jgi:hypothetical protein
MSIIDSLNPVSALINSVMTVVNKIWPDQTEIQKAQLTAQLQAAVLESDLAKAQIKVNEVEAANSKLFVSGWRPFVGWACGMAFVWAYVAQPVVTWVAVVMFHQTLPSLPALDMGNLLAILTGMLGFGSLRTYEKIKGITK